MIKSISISKNTAQRFIMGRRIDNKENIMEQTQKTSYWSRSSGFPVGAMALFSFRWVNDILNAWGYKPLSGMGLLIGFGMWLGILTLALAVDYGLHRVGLSQPVRSGAWFAALIGPYAGMVALNEWGNLIGSQVIGILSTLFAFWFGYWAEDRLRRKK